MPLTKPSPALIPAPLRIDRYGNDPTFSERADTLPLTTGSPFTFTSVISETVPDVRAGDVIDVWANCQVTSEHQYNVMAASFIAIGTSSSDTTGEDVTERTGQNFNREEHHFIIQQFGRFEATADMGTVHFNLVVYVASSAAASGDTIIVDQDYGRMIVTRYRG